MDGHPGASVSSPGSEAAAGWCGDLARVRAATVSKAADGGAEAPSELGELFLPGAPG